MSTTGAENEPGGPAEDARLAEAKPPEGERARESERARCRGGARGAASRARAEAARAAAEPAARRARQAAAVRAARWALVCLYNMSAEGQKGLGNNRWQAQLDAVQACNKKSEAAEGTQVPKGADERQRRSSEVRIGYTHSHTDEND